MLSKIDSTIKNASNADNTIIAITSPIIPFDSYACYNTIIITQGGGMDYTYLDLYYVCIAITVVIGLLGLAGRWWE